jgi:hypothetical protein
MGAKGTASVEGIDHFRSGQLLVFANQSLDHSELFVDSLLELGMLEAGRRHRGRQVFNHPLVLFDLFHVGLDLLIAVGFLYVAGWEKRFGAPVV